MPHIRQKFWLSFAILCAILFLQKPVSASQNTDLATNNHPKLTQSNVDELIGRVAESGRIRVLVQLDLAIELEGNLRSAEARSSQRAMIAHAQSVLQQDSEQLDGLTFLSGFETLPIVVMEVDAAGLESLQQRSDITHIVEDEPFFPSSLPQLESSMAVIGAGAFHNEGIDGTGAAIAVLDTGVDVQHIAFSSSSRGGSRIVAGGCFSTESTTYGVVHSVCPNGASSDTQLLAGDDCVAIAQELGLGLAVTDCKHGTHVAGILGANDGEAMVGVAPDVDLIPIQVFSAFESYRRMLSFTSDQIKGLEYVLTLADDFNIVAVNMSLGGSYNPEACDYDMRRQAILNLQSVGVATIVAAGNEGFRDGVGKPSCIDEAITVGATNDDDTVASFSNISAQIDLLAPGSGIGSTFPNNSTGSMSGTSMAAPIVTGAFALLEESNPEMTIEEKLEILQESGRPIDDQRSGGTVTGMTRIDLTSAKQHLAGTIQLEVQTNPLFFQQRTESISLVATNDSNTKAQSLVISATLPSSVFIVENSISHQGSADSNMIFWKNQTLEPNTTLTVTFEAIINGAESILLTGAIKDSENRQDEESISVPVRPILVCNSFESFESGLPEAQDGWLLENGKHGQIRTSNQFKTHGAHSLILEDTSHDGVTNLSFIEMGVDMTHSSLQHVDISWMGHGFYTHHADTGLFVSTDQGNSWLKIAALASKGQWEQLHINLADVIGNSATGVLLFRVQFFGDGWIDPANMHLSSGLIIDELQFNCGKSLVWDGGGETADWSDPLNWSPNLRPHGNNLIFDSTSPLLSEIDSSFNRPIGNLVFEPSWTGTLTQTAPLTINGDYIQRGGTVILESNDSLNVDGSFIFEGGALQQTKMLQPAGSAFFAINNSTMSQIKYGGIVFAPTEFGQPAADLTITIAAQSWPNSGCTQAGLPLINRCITISSSAENLQRLRAKIWLDQAEISQSGIEDLLPEVDYHQGNEEGAPIGIDPPEENAQQVSMMAFNNGGWTTIERYHLAMAGTKPYVEIDLEQPDLIMIQRVERVPTAVVLASFQTDRANNRSLKESLYLISTFGLLLLTGLTLWLHLESNNQLSYAFNQIEQDNHQNNDHL